MSKLAKKYHLGQYHLNQFEQPYRSTEIFVKWLEENGFLGSGRGGAKVLDMACGAGANVLYMANKYKDMQFVGLDINKEHIDYGNEILLSNSKYGNCRLYEGDWFNISPNLKNEFNGIVSFQSLLMFSDYKEALQKLVDLQPEWIAVSSLFYEGDIEYTIKFRNYYRPTNGKEYTDSYYNIHSIIRYRKYMEKQGYTNMIYLPYKIDIDLPKPDSMDIGTYTVRTVNGDRIQISAAMMMPWYFVVAYK